MNESPRHFRKKPVVITAWQTDAPFDIKTLEGTMRADAGDWIITGVKGEIYPCKPDIFEATYEEMVRGAEAATVPVRPVVLPPIPGTPRSFRFLDGQPHDFDCPRLLPENRQGNYTICCKAEADRQKAAGA